MTLHSRVVAVLTPALLTVMAAVAQTDAPKTESGVTFKQPRVGMNETAAITPSAKPSTPVTGAVRPVASKTVSDLEDLDEKKQTLETELRYARNKLDAAQKKLSVNSAAGNAEQVEKLNVEIRDWEARIKASKEQLDTVEAEMGKVRPGGAPAFTGAGGDLLLPGETIEIYVNEDQSFNGRYIVRRGGYIILPQVGRIVVAGKALDQAEAGVKRALEGSQLTRATVLIERVEGKDVEGGAVILLNGEFKSPHPFKIRPGTAPTLVSVMLSCGGFTDRADLTHVKVMRMVQGRPVVEEVNVQKIIDGNSSGLGSDMSLTEGDVITVPAGPVNQIFVTGNVKRQGAQGFVPGERLTAYGAVLNAGGLARYADEKRTHVLRAMPDGTKRKIPVDLIAIKKGRKQDLVLQPNDILVVPEKWFSF